MRTPLPTLTLALLLSGGLSPPVGAQTVYRCGSQYGDQPCPSAKIVDVTPAVRDPGRVGTSQVFSCLRHDGGRFWSSVHCREKNALVERIESVPADLPWEEQVRLADEQTRQGYAVQRQLLRPAAAPAAAPAPRAQPDCSRYSEQVTHYDALARQRQTAEGQDWIAQRRREARDAQFRAGC